LFCCEFTEIEGEEVESKDSEGRTNLFEEVRSVEVEIMGMDEWEEFGEKSIDSDVLNSSENNDDREEGIARV
jgi:hypothetical protein